jgi:cysteine desulfurase
MKLPIYLDNAASTPVDPRVVDAMLPYLSEHIGNPASTHSYGRRAKAAVEEARAEVARLLNANAHEIAWTSGATESDNLAIKGAAYGAKDRGRHLVTLETEHKAVLDTMLELKRQGFEVTFLTPGPDGLLDLDTLRAALRPDTTLVSVMLVNNEIGTIQDIAAIGALLKNRGVLFHVDAAQATGKVPIDVERSPVDLMSLTAHKTYGPKGVGALYVRSGVRIDAQMHGGGHERGMRSGTLATHQIVGMGEAFRIARAEMQTESARIKDLRDRLWNGLRDLPGLRLNGDMEHRIAGNLNLTLTFQNCENLVDSLMDVAISSASACSSGSQTPSHVLQAIGADGAASLRITVGRFNTEEEIDHAIGHLRDKIERCQGPAARAAA